ncbi:hypothetical protein [uncultured Shewanella sp.]|uniref:hypothetical protein n=1 Tax=uncultured Shewanella sp. TaxID=173975 RepID=UPI002614719D|nr:hypothetical protein [uncultured Shewanella sp.]
MMKYSLFRLLINVFFYFSVSNIVYAGAFSDKFVNDLLNEKDVNGLMLSLQKDWTIKHFPSYYGMRLIEKKKEQLQLDTLGTFPALFDIELSTFAYEHTLPHSMPFLDAMMDTSEELVAAKKVKTRGLLINIPLSIVNMPINVGVLSYASHLTSASFADNPSLPANTVENVNELSNQTVINLDLQLSMALFDDVKLGVSGSHLISQSQFTATNFDDGLPNISYSTLTAGMAYDWNEIHFSTEIDLYRQADWDQGLSAQFWRVGGYVTPFSWLGIELNYYYNVTNKQESLYSMGSEFKFGDKFSVDFSGVYRQSNHIEGLLRTSYDF